MIHSSFHAMPRLEAPRALRAGWVLLALQRVQRALKALPRHLRSHAAIVTHLQPAQEGHVFQGSAVQCGSPSGIGASLVHSKGSWGGCTCSIDEAESGVKGSGAATRRLSPSRSNCRRSRPARRHALLSFRRSTTVCAASGAPV